MKQLLIEFVKRSRLYPKLKSMFYQTSEKDYKNTLLNSSEANEYIKELLKNEKPFLISRLGSSELAIFKSNLKHKPYTKKDKFTIQNNAGFFPLDSHSLDQFCQLYYTSISKVDMFGISFIPYEDIIINNYSPDSKLTRLRNLEPYFFTDPWSKFLEGKKVLVIHPFAKSIQKQYLNRQLLFSSNKVLPRFELITYEAIQTLGGQHETYTTWFDALNSMKNDIAKLNFDIAIVGAGVYGLPLSSYIKDLGKKAIHLGGATQMLFGVYGQRWAIHPDFQDIINEHWIRPQENEKPNNANKVENACYW